MILLPKFHFNYVVAAAACQLSNTSNTATYKFRMVVIRATNCKYSDADLPLRARTGVSFVRKAKGKLCQLSCKTCSNSVDKFQGVTVLDSTARCGHHPTEYVTGVTECQSRTCRAEALQLAMQANREPLFAALLPAARHGGAESDAQQYQEQH